jgi:hypothetical protein
MTARVLCRRNVQDDGSTRSDLTTRLVETPGDGLDVSDVGRFGVQRAEHLELTRVGWRFGRAMVNVILLVCE